MNIGNSLNTKIKADTKCPTFCRRDIQIPFLTWKLLHFDSNFCLFLWVQNQWLGAEQTSYYPNQWWPSLLMHTCITGPQWVNTLRPRQDCRHFPDNIFKCIFFNENVWILIKISLTFIPKAPINNIPALVQIMAWRRPGDKPLYEPMMLVYLCIYASLCLNELMGILATDLATNWEKNMFLKITIAYVCFDIVGFFTCNHLQSFSQKWEQIMYCFTESLTLN